MASSLSNLVNNLSEEIYKMKFKYRHDGKKCETCKIKCKYCDYYLEYSDFKDDLINLNVCVETKIINKSLMKS